MFKINFKIIFLGIILLFPLIINAQTKAEVFNVERKYDFYNRTEISAVLQKTTNQLHFYVEEKWWNSLTEQEKSLLDEKIYNLSNEFERKIYPELTSIFGQEAEFGANNDKRITVLIHRMFSDVGGYFSSGDIYEKIQYPKSNQRKIVYLNGHHINSVDAKSYLAHEFMHLITVNQKNLKRNINEEVWLNEARSEYAPTLLGYNNVFDKSYLEKRVNDFLENPADSLTEWLNLKQDYAAVNLFTHYLVDHYGIKILADSLKSDKKGIESINYALSKNSVKQDFEQIFNDWLIAVLINDCSVGSKYCYLNNNLKQLKIEPTVYQFPEAEVELLIDHNITYWAGNWHKFVGGEKYFILKFKGDSQADFKVPYLLCNIQNKCSVYFIDLNREKNGEITINDFKTKYQSLIVMPFAKDKINGFNGKENYFKTSLIALTKKSNNQETDNDSIKNLMSQIEELRKQINEYQRKINVLLGVQGETSCSKLNNNLYFGMTNNSEVRCLQEFLKNQGPDIYPEALVTGNFLSLTKQAVIRFQEKYSQEILAPLNLKQGTGFVGPSTILKINNLIN